MYLLDKGFIEGADLVNGDYSVTQMQTRNSIFKVVRKKKKSLFVKQLNSFDPNNTYVLQKDATCLWLIKNEQSYGELSKHVPEYFGYDPEKQVLITEYLPGSMNLQDFIRGKDALPDRILEQLADIMAAYHFNANQAVESSRSAQFFPQQIPWILNIVDLASPQNIASLGKDGQNPIVHIVKTNPSFVQLIRNIKDNWIRASLIHGDIKWANLLIYNLPDEPELKLIDWEIADIGDPMWDIAGILSAMVTHELLYKNPSGPAQPYIPIQTGINDIQAVWPVFRKFWLVYTKRRKPGQQEDTIALSKCIQYAGGRLIQSAVEHNMMLPQIQPGAIRLLQASYTVLENHRHILNILTSFQDKVEA